MSRVLVIAGHHEGEFFSLPDNWSLNPSYQLSTPSKQWPLRGSAGFLDPDYIFYNYYIYKIHYRNPDRVWYVAMPTNDLRDPVVIAMDSMFRTAEVRALDE